MNIKSLLVFLTIFTFAPLAHAASSVHIDPAGVCGILGSNFLANAEDVVLTEDTAINDTKSRAKVRTLKCEADLPTLPPAGTAVNYDKGNTNLLCGIVTDTTTNPVTILETDRWHENISATGHATLECVYLMPASQ